MKTIGKMQLIILSGLALLTSGCINIDMRLQPEDASVKEVREGGDCVYIIFGVGFGTATLEQAKMNTGKRDQSGVFVRSETPITKVRRVWIHDAQFLFFGKRCIEVTGE